MNRRRIQPRPVVELETITLRLPAELVHAVDDYAKHLGGSSDRTYVITRRSSWPSAQPTTTAKPARTDPTTPATLPVWPSDRDPRSHFRRTRQRGPRGLAGPFREYACIHGRGFPFLRRRPFRHPPVRDVRHAEDHEPKPPDRGPAAR